MGLTQINPNFARQIIERYTLAAPFRREEVDFVYYDPAEEKRPPVISHTQLNLRLLFQFQILYQAGQKNVLNFPMLQQVLSHSQTGESQPMPLASRGRWHGDGSGKNEKKGEPFPSMIRLQRERRQNIDVRFLDSWVKQLTEAETQSVAQRMEQAGLLSSASAGNAYQILRDWDAVAPDQKEKIALWMQEQANRNGEAGYLGQLLSQREPALVETAGVRNPSSGAENRELWKQLISQEQIRERETADWLMQAGAEVLVFLKGQRDGFQGERDEFLRLASESSGAEAAEQIVRYWDDSAETEAEEQRKNLLPILQKMAGANARQAALLYRNVEKLSLYQNKAQVAAARLESSAAGAGEKPFWDLVRAHPEQIQQILQQTELFHRSEFQELDRQRRETGEGREPLFPFPVFETIFRRLQREETFSPEREQLVRQASAQWAPEDSRLLARFLGVPFWESQTEERQRKGGEGPEEGLSARSFESVFRLLRERPADAAERERLFAWTKQQLGSVTARWLQEALEESQPENRFWLPDSVKVLFQGQETAWRELAEEAGAALLPPEAEGPWTLVLRNHAGLETVRNRLRQLAEARMGASAGETLRQAFREIQPVLRRERGAVLQPETPGGQRSGRLPAQAFPESDPVQTVLESDPVKGEMVSGMEAAPDYLGVPETWEAPDHLETPETEAVPGYPEEPELHLRREQMPGAENRQPAPSQLPPSQQASSQQAPSRPESSLLESSRPGTGLEFQTEPSRERQGAFLSGLEASESERVAARVQAPGSIPEQTASLGSRKAGEPETVSLSADASVPGAAADRPGVLTDTDVSDDSDAFFHREAPDHRDAPVYQETPGYPEEPELRLRREASPAEEPGTVSSQDLRTVSRPAEASGPAAETGFREASAGAAAGQGAREPSGETGAGSSVPSSWASETAPVLRKSPEAEASQGRREGPEAEASQGRREGPEPAAAQGRREGLESETAPDRPALPEYSAPLDYPEEPELRLRRESPSGAGARAGQSREAEAPGGSGETAETAVPLGTAGKTVLPEAAASPGTASYPGIAAPQTQVVAPQAQAAAPPQGDAGVLAVTPDRPALQGRSDSPDASASPDRWDASDVSDSLDTSESPSSPAYRGAPGYPEELELQLRREFPSTAGGSQSEGELDKIQPVRPKELRSQDSRLPGEAIGGKEEQEALETETVPSAAESLNRQNTPEYRGAPGYPEEPELRLRQGNMAAAEMAGGPGLPQREVPQVSRASASPSPEGETRGPARQAEVSQGRQKRTGSGLDGAGGREPEPLAAGADHTAAKFGQPGGRGEGKNLEPAGLEPAEDPEYRAAPGYPAEPELRLRRGIPSLSEEGGLAAATPLPEAGRTGSSQGEAGGTGPFFQLDGLEQTPRLFAEAIQKKWQVGAARDAQGTSGLAYRALASGSPFRREGGESLPASGRNGLNFGGGTAAGTGQIFRGGTAAGTGQIFRDGTAAGTGQIFRGGTLPRAGLHLRSGSNPMTGQNSGGRPDWVTGQSLGAGGHSTVGLNPIAGTSAIAGANLITGRNPGMGRNQGVGRNPGMGRNLGTGRNLRAGRNLDAGSKLGNGQNRGTTWDPVNFPAGETENTFGQPFPSPDLLPRREAGALESVQREAPNLQFLQSANRKGPDWQETEGRVRKLEEQIQMQKTVVNQLSESRQGRESFPLPDTGEIARAVMKRLERELRLEKMRKGLL